MLLAVAVPGCGGDDGSDSGGERRAEDPAPERTATILGTDLHPEGPPALIAGQSFALYGAASGARDVDLFASPHPHRGWRRLATRRVTGDLTFHLRPRINTRYTARARVPVTRADGRVHFYLREDGRGPLRRVATGRPRQAGANAIVVTARFPDPDPRNSDRFVSCAVGLLAEGFGHPSPSEPECGNRVMAATKRRLNAPG